MTNLSMLSLALICALSLAGCGSAIPSVELPPVSSPERVVETTTVPGVDHTLPLDPDEEPTIWTLRLVDGADSGHLVLAGEGEHAVCTLDVANIPVYLDGAIADPSALEDGMAVELAFNGSVLDSCPGKLGEVYSLTVHRLGTAESPGGGFYDLCGLYLQVLEDLWDRDAGLNGGAVYVSVDLSQAPGGLTEGEKSAVAWVFAQRHNAIPLTLTYDQLLEEGYLTEITPEGAGTKSYTWEDGLLFSITYDASREGEIYSLPVVAFDAQKWRSPLGAYFFSGCSAVWPEFGTWSGYNVGSEVIA